MVIHPQTKKELEGLLRILDKYGEDKTLWYIRNVYLCDNRGKRVKSPKEKASKSQIGVYFWQVV